MRAYRIALIAPIFLLGLTGIAAGAEINQEANLPAPVVGTQLFNPKLTGNTDCVSNVSVIAQLKMDEMKVGGSTVVLTGGIDQAFADTWRRHLHMGSVPVSMIVAHLFENPLNASLIVDTVELDSQGCAMSRTLMAAGEWSALLHDAVGEEA